MGFGSNPISVGGKSAKDYDIVLVGDEELMRALQGLDYKTQQKYNKRIVRDAARQTIVKKLQAASPVGPTGNLKRSMGVVTGKSKRSAVAFAGPRMSNGRGVDKATHSGWLANIIEFNKGQLRYPGPSYRGVKKRPKTPQGVRVHSGIMPTTHKGFVRRAILGSLKDAENHMMTSIRKIIIKEWNSKVKKGLI